MTKEQNDVFNHIKQDFTLISSNYLGAKIVVQCKSNDRYYRYIIAENGDATKETFEKVGERSCYGWDMNVHGWTRINPSAADLLEKERQSGDESFDVVVEKELKEEKKMAINFSEIYKEAYEEAFSDFVHSNKEDLIRYAEDSTREKIIDHLNDEIDFEDVAHNIIDEVIDYYIEYDADSSDDALEEIITDCIFE